MHALVIISVRPWLDMQVLSLAVSKMCELNGKAWTIFARDAYCTSLNVAARNCVRSFRGLRSLASRPAISRQE